MTKAGYLFEMKPANECCMHGVWVLDPRCPRCQWWQDTDLTAEECQAPWAELEARYLRETAPGIRKKKRA